MKDRPNRKHLDKKKNRQRFDDYNDDQFLQKKASKSFKQKKRNLYDEDFLEEIEKYK